MINRSVKKLIPSIVVTVIIALVLTVSTLAWLQSNGIVRHDDNEMIIEGDTYDIVVVRRTVYDDYPNSSGIHDSLLGEGYDYSELDTSEGANLAFELINEFEYDHDYYLMPSAYGRLEFYIRPHEGIEAFTVNLKVSLGGFKNNIVDDGISETVETVKVTNDSILDILNGHVLFFASRIGSSAEYYKYNNLLENGELSISFDANSQKDPIKTDCFKVVLYWCWPVTYDDISNNITSSGVINDNERLKYPYELRGYIDDNRSCFFVSHTYSDDPELLNEGYNEGDQLIGTNVSYLVVYIDND